MFDSFFYFSASGNVPRVQEADPETPEDDVRGLQDQPQLGQGLQGESPRVRLAWACIVRARMPFFDPIAIAGDLNILHFKFTN